MSSTDRAMLLLILRTIVELLGDGRLNSRRIDTLIRVVEEFGEGVL